MPDAVPEFQGALVRLAELLRGDIAKLLGASMGRLDRYEQLAFITDAYPELITPYLAASAELTAQWYAEQPTTDANPPTPTSAAPAPVEQLGIQGRWAIVQSKPVAALQGAGQRMVFNASRETVIASAAFAPVLSTL